MSTPTSEAETIRRALAVEGALLQLVNRMAELGLISINDAITMLEQLSRSSDFSKARVSPSMANLNRLKALRGDDPDLAPGADRLG